MNYNRRRQDADVYELTVKRNDIKKFCVLGSFDYIRKVYKRVEYTYWNHQIWNYDLSIRIL